MDKAEQTRAWRRMILQAKRASRLLNEGYIIFDSFGDEITGFQFFRGMIRTDRKYSIIGYVHKKSDLLNPDYKSVWNTQTTPFDDWKIINTKKPLLGKYL